MTSEARARTVEDDEQTDTKLKRKITGPLLFLFILGDVLGAGIRHTGRGDGRWCGSPGSDSGLAVASLSVAVVAGGFRRCVVGELAWRRRAQSAAPAPQLLYLRAEFLSASLLGIMLVRFTHSSTLSRERGDLLAQ